MNGFHRYSGWTVVMLVALCLGSGFHTILADEEETGLPLPSWSKEEIDAMRAHPKIVPALGELLGLPDEGSAIAQIQDSALAPLQPATVADTPDTRQPYADLSRFLPPSLFGPYAPPLRRLAAMTPLADVPPLFLSECLQASADSYLIDPNHELAEASSEDFQRFLAFHAAGARIGMKLILTGRRQKLPADADLASLATGSAACIVVCAYGEPWRTRLFMSRTILDRIPIADLNDVLEDCVANAQKAADPDDQIHRMLVRLSVRLFWLQRRFLSAPPIDLPEEQGNRAEVLPLTKNVPLARQSVWTWAGIAALGLLAAYTAWRWHLYKLRHYQWLLPEPGDKIVPRFGGPHCGGGVSIRYR